MYASPSPSLKQQSAYPMTYIPNSPLNNMGYNYPQTFAPTGYHPQAYQPQGFGYASKPLSAPNLQPQQPIITGATGIKTIEQLNRGISDPTLIKQQQKAVLGTSAQQGLSFQSSSQRIGIQQGYSQIQYIPYESYYIDYQQRQFVQNVTVPVERVIRDYYAIEHVVDFVPKQIEQTIVEMVPEERTSNKLYYVPIQTQVIHLPQGDNIPQKGQKTVTQQQKTVNVINTANSQQRIISRQASQVQGYPIAKQIIQKQPYRQKQIILQVQQPRKYQPQVITNKIQLPFVNQIQPEMFIRQGVEETQTVYANPPKLIQQLPQQVQKNEPYTRVQYPGLNQIQPEVVIRKNFEQTKPIYNSPPKLIQLSNQPPGQFKQTQQSLRANQAELQRKMPIPKDAKVNYQYSTRSERILTPQQLKAMGIQPRSPTTSPTASPTKIQTQTQPQPQLIRPQPVTQTLLPSQQTLNPTLIKNRQVDLADSEHIDITKSTFHAFYGSSNQQHQTLSQGGFNSTNPAFYTNTGNNQSAFSFGSQGNNNSSVNVNRSTGGFAPILENQANRISNGSVYDYDQYRGDY